MHSLYKVMASYPPPGYQFLVGQTRWDGVSSAVAKVNPIYAFQERILSRLIPVNIVKASIERFKKPPQGTDLTYSTGHLVFRDEPWVIDLEFVTQLAGFSLTYFHRYKKLIEKVLSSEYCQKIICWTEAGKRTVLENMNCQGFEHKVEVVYLPVPTKNFTKDYTNSGKVKLLFVGSANIAGEFIIDGGVEVLEAFSQLNNRYDNLELVIRSDLPRSVKVKYGKTNNIRIIDEIIPWEQLENEFKSADIFLFPAHTTPGLVILDAMSYELPVITTDVWANPEMVENGKTGFVIKKPERVQYYVENFIPNWDYIPESRFMRAIKNFDPKVIDELVAKASLLIENEELRRQMGKQGRKEIETGKFSLKKRNEKLGKIFDEATA
ncbi:glycosyltransferase family 4 protein [Chloroflexota bacterium]